MHWWHWLNHCNVLITYVPIFLYSLCKVALEDHLETAIGVDWFLWSWRFIVLMNIVLVHCSCDCTGCLFTLRFNSRQGCLLLKPFTARDQTELRFQYGMAHPLRSLVIGSFIHVPSLATSRLVAVRKRILSVVTTLLLDLSWLQTMRGV